LGRGKFTADAAPGTVAATGANGAAMPLVTAEDVAVTAVFDTE